MRGPWARTGLALALIVALSALASVWADTAAQGAVEVGPHEAYQIVCEILEDESWMDDGVMHIRNRRLASVVISDHAAHAGTGTIVSNGDHDTQGGHMVYAGTLEIRPDALDGYWAGSWSMVMDADGLRGQAVLLGNGAFDGMYIVSAITPLPPAQLETFAYACGGRAPIAGTHAVGAYHRLRP